jgi:hypothetical protein
LNVPERILLPARFGFAGLGLVIVAFLGGCDASSDTNVARAGTPTARAALFDSLIVWTARREAFSPLKEAAMQYSPLEEMGKLRDDIVAADSEEELYYALVRLSNARRDHHLDVTPVPDGLRIQQGPALQAPVRILGDFSSLDVPEFFVSAVDMDAWDDAESAGWSRTGGIPELGDKVVLVDGLTIPEFIAAFEVYMPYSSRHGKVWDLATIMTHRDPLAVPPWLYEADEGLEMELESASGERYSTTLPYLEAGRVELPFADAPMYPGFTTVLAQQNFDVLLPDDGQLIVLLRWLDFEEELVQDVADLMELAEARDLLGHALIIDVTDSSGGSGGAYAIQRLVSRPFKTTFGNIRLSDAGVRWVEQRLARGVDENAPDLFGMDLSGRWLIEWLETDVQEAIARGEEYTEAVPFKSTHLPSDSDGTIEPAPVHFTGPIAILGGPRGGSHLDQFVSMLADNGLARTVGMPAGGYSNTWEASEVLTLPLGGGDDGGEEGVQPVATFMWNIGHTLRPTGEILEGNAVTPELYIPLTRGNFRTYHQDLLQAALRLMATRPAA